MNHNCLHHYHSCLNGSTDGGLNPAEPALSGEEGGMTVNVMTHRAGSGHVPISIHRHITWPHKNLNPDSDRRNRLECFVSLPPILPQWVLIMQPSWHVTWHVAPAACLISDQCGSGSGASGVTGDSRLEAGVFQPNTAASCSLVFINSDTNTTWHGASRVTLVQHSALHPIRHSSITLCNVILAICKVDCRGRVTLWCIMRGMR